MAKRPRIAVVGSANIDLTTFADRFPKPGETIFGQKFHLGFGGKGANQAVAARLCGADVSMIARVGHDLFGPAFATKPRGKVGMRMPQHEHQAWDQPAWNDLHALHVAFFDPVEQLV